MKTRVTELLGIEYPIIQGGMAWVATHELASAVSNRLFCLLMSCIRSSEQVEHRLPGCVSRFRQQKKKPTSRLE